MFKRKLSEVLLKTAKSFPVTVLTGPRQSGKTTLLGVLFPKYKYITLESPDRLLNAKDDPRGFLDQFVSGGVIDEVQNFPELFSYIQEYIDQKKIKGPLILSGSQNFLLSQKTSQTLAGRAAVLELPTLTYQEFQSHPNISDLDIWTYIYHGSYPRPYQDKLDLKIWYTSYIRTYIERDVRLLVSISDISRFQRFLRVCASYHGKILNLQALATACGISQPTASAWLSILESSYIVFRLPPYYKNFKKRLVKSPKLYFYDSSLLCLLLGIESVDHLEAHSERGSIFEGFVVAELKKHMMTHLDHDALYYFRDHRGLEVDVIIEKGQALHAVEIKSAKTVFPGDTNTLNKWKSLDPSADISTHLVYAGNELNRITDTQVWPWNKIPEIWAEKNGAD